MPVNLLALCKVDNVSTIKRVKVTAEVQNQLEGVFIQQEQTFFENVTEEVPFDGGWNPEQNELLFADMTAEATAVLTAAQGNIVAMPEVNAPAFAEEGIKALAVLVQNPAGPRLLLQEFSARQILEKRFNLVLSGDTFNRLTQPAFSIGATLAGVIQNNRIKFKRYSRIKQIFDLSDLYQEATEAELTSFCALDTLHIADATAFKTMADQKMKKLVHAIAGRSTLTQHTPQQIAEAAASEGLQIDIVNNKIAMPTVKASAKALLHFLDHGLYRVSLTGQTYITNSKRLYTGE